MASCGASSCPYFYESVVWPDGEKSAAASSAVESAPETPYPPDRSEIGPCLSHHPFEGDVDHHSRQNRGQLLERSVLRVARLSDGAPLGEMGIARHLGHRVHRRHARVRGRKSRHPVVAVTSGERRAEVVADRVLGALNAQSTLPNAFDESQIETLQNMANQVAGALENARLFTETQANLDEISRRG